MDQKLAKVILPAATGAGSAILVFIIKDIVLFEIRERRQAKRELLDRKLTKLYGPIAVALKGGEGLLGNTFRDDQIFATFTENMHFLSPKLFEIVSEHMKLTKSVRGTEISRVDGEKVIEFNKRFTEVFYLGFESLRKEYQGVHGDGWRGGSTRP